MTHGNTPTRRVKTADTIFGILEFLKVEGGATTAEVADHLDIAESTAHDHLVTLADMGFVRKEDYKHLLSLRFLDFGMESKNQYDIATVAQPTLDNLAKETSERIWLYVDEFGRAVALTTAVGEHAVQTAGRIGKALPIHCAAGGKAMLAHYSEERVCEIVDRHGLKQTSPNTITDIDTLLTDLETVRERGYSTNDGESLETLRAVGSPVIVDGEILGGLSIVGPKHRLQGDRFKQSLPELVMGAANEIELNMTDFSESAL